MFVNVLAAIVIIAICAKLYALIITGRYKIKKNLKGKVVVITGASAGIGTETVRELAKHGATIHVLARDLSKAERVLAPIRDETGNRNIHIHRVNLSDFSTVRTFAKDFLATKSPIHVLINNAGTASTTRRVTIDGCEETCQANHLSHFLLTNLLLDRIKASAPSRIINLTSSAHFGVGTRVGGNVSFNPEDFSFERTPYESFTAYAWSKLENIYFTTELAYRLRGQGVTVNCAHPGGVRTDIINGMGKFSVIGLCVWILWPFFKTAHEGAQTTLFLAVADEVEHVTGTYFADCKPAATLLLAADSNIAEKVWRESEKLTKMKDE